MKNALMGVFFICEHQQKYINQSLTIIHCRRNMVSR